MPFLFAVDLNEAFCHWSQCLITTLYLFQHRMILLSYNKTGGALRSRDKLRLGLLGLLGLRPVYESSSVTVTEDPPSGQSFGTDNTVTLPDIPRILLLRAKLELEVVTLEALLLLRRSIHGNSLTRLERCPTCFYWAHRWPLVSLETQNTLSTWPCLKEQSHVTCKYHWKGERVRHLVIVNRRNHQPASPSVADGEYTGFIPLKSSICHCRAQLDFFTSSSLCRHLCCSRCQSHWYFHPINILS